MPEIVRRTELLPAEYLSETARAEGELASRPQSWQRIHTPESVEEAEQARRRIAFDELWTIFAALDTEREARHALEARKPVTPEHVENFTNAFIENAPFPLTPSQQSAIESLQEQFVLNRPLRQFIQGEVGSGKTLVAAYALFLQASVGGQSLYLVPTTVLAEQHLQNLRPMAEKLGIEIAPWTAASKGSSEARVLIGTHSLLHHTDSFSPDLIVVDEEHRFGVGQREYIWDENHPPHLITMTATPIPRTLAHVLYGNQAVSFLEPIPGKERDITTRVFSPTKLDAHLQWLATKIVEESTQAFLIAPLIEPSETEAFADVYDATTLYKRVTQLFPHFRIGLVTGRTPAAEKQALLEAMRKKELAILVATPVIEVGIDIPEASIITILSAERFGFAQLHQLRGRVGRSGQSGWCFLVPSPGKTAQRLRLLESTTNGHELAELDLQNRGAGEFLGTRQTGWDGLRVATWMDLPLIELVKRLYTREKQV
ncbi:DEAD/DEAH box helicase family protein [Candidatus Woesebacteria bacterium]|nr:DEAD/DEAH box helicase family protein [Candidatus Woesebacteria bacterium]